MAARGRLTEGFLYVWQRPDLKAVLLMLFLIGTFGLNFPIFLATMSVTVFHTGAAAYGLSSSILAIGTVAGALLAASRARPSMTLLSVSAAAFAMGCALAATVPNYALFALTLIILGVSAQTFLTSTNSFLQLSAEPNMRGRVIAIVVAVAVGGTPIGAPFVGWIADRFGPRWALGVGVASGVTAAIVALLYLAKHRHLRVRVDAGRLCFSMRNSEPATPTRP